MHKYVLSNAHFYCETVDMSRPFPSSSPLDDPSWEFVWNRWLSAALRAVGLPTHCPHLMQVHATLEQHPCSVLGVQAFSSCSSALFQLFLCSVSAFLCSNGSNCSSAASFLCSSCLQECLLFGKLRVLSLWFYTDLDIILLDHATLNHTTIQPFWVVLCALPFSVCTCQTALCYAHSLSRCLSCHLMTPSSPPPCTIDTKLKALRCCHRKCQASQGSSGHTPCLPAVNLHVCSPGTCTHCSMPRPVCHTQCV